MRFDIFERFRRHRDAVDNKSAVLNETGAGAEIVSKTKEHIRRFKFQRRLRKKKQPRKNQPRDVLLDNTNDDRTDRDSLSSKSSSSSSNNNIYNNNDQHRCDASRVAEVGRPPKRLLRKKERMTFKIHDFARCAKKRGEYCLTPALKAHGYNWKLQVYPRGDNRSDETTEYLSCFLHYFGSPNVRQAPVAKVEYVCGAYKTETQVCTFAVEKGKCSTSWGLENFIKRNTIIQNCLDEDGALSLNVNIQIAIDPKVVWYPPWMRQETTLMQLYHSTEETGDATFRLTTISNRKDCSPSRSTSSSICRYYKAHKMILALRARILYELVCEESNSSGDERECNAAIVDLPGIDCDTFEAMLEHIYTVKQPIIEDEEAAKKLLVAADRFCLTDLKLYVESILVDRFTAVGNAASLLLFADSHSCALLKETTMDLYANDPNSVMHTPYWGMVEESKTILSELSKHVHTGCRQNFHGDRRNDTESHNSNKRGHSSNSDNMDRLDVFSIRERLTEYVLDLDGSRETLLGRLKKKLKEQAECKG